MYVYFLRHYLCIRQKYISSLMETQKFTIPNTDEILRENLKMLKEQASMIQSEIEFIETCLNIRGRKPLILEPQKTPYAKSTKDSNSPKSSGSKFVVTLDFLKAEQRFLSVAELAELFDNAGLKGQYSGRFNGNLSASLGQKVRAKKMSYYQVGNVGYYGLSGWVDENGNPKPEYRHDKTIEPS